MLRRREMVLPADDGLIKFDDMTFGVTTNTSPYFQATTSNGNHFNVFFYRRSASGYYPYFSPHEISNAWSSDWPALGSYEIGDEIDMYLKNFTVVSQASTTGTDKTDATFRKLSDGSIGFGVGSADTAYTIPNTVGLVGDFHYNTVATAANSFNCFRLLGRNTSTQVMKCRIEFDLELYINGARLI